MKLKFKFDPVSGLHISEDYRIRKGYDLVGLRRLSWWYGSCRGTELGKFDSFGMAQDVLAVHAAGGDWKSAAATWRPA
jgi:hypothetical protein